MPLQLRERSLDEDQLGYLEKVLRDDAPAREALAAARGREDRRLLAGIFNGRPVAMLLVARAGDRWRVEQLVVHPATRGRGVGTGLLRLAGEWLPLSWPAVLEEMAQKAGLVPEHRDLQADRG